MMTFLRHPYALWISRYILGFIFILAGIEKIALPDVFAANVLAYQIVPFALINILALFLPWAEVLCGIYLLAGFKVRASAAILSAVLIVFIVAIAIAMAKGLSIDCGCFGSAHATPVGWQKIIEDTGMLLLGMHLFFFSELKSVSDQPTEHPV